MDGANPLTNDIEFRGMNRARAGTPLTSGNPHEASRSGHRPDRRREPGIDKGDENQSPLYPSNNQKEMPTTQSFLVSSKPCLYPRPHGTAIVSPQDLRLPRHPSNQAGARGGGKNSLVTPGPESIDSLELLCYPHCAPRCSIRQRSRCAGILLRHMNIGSTLYRRTPPPARAPLQVCLWLLLCVGLLCGNSSDVHAKAKPNRAPRPEPELKFSISPSPRIPTTSQPAP